MTISAVDLGPQSDPPDDATADTLAWLQQFAVPRREPGEIDRVQAARALHTSDDKAEQQLDALVAQGLMTVREVVSANSKVMKVWRRV